MLKKSNLKQSRTVGIIGGLGPKTAFAFAQRLNDRFTSIMNMQPNMVLENLAISDELLQQMAYGKNHPKILELLLQSVQKLNRASVDFIVIPCNTVHVFIKEIRQQSKVPVLSIIEECAKRCKKMNVKRVGILASGTSVKQKLHADELKKNGIETILPTAEDQQKINELIVRINRDKHTPEDKELVRNIIQKIKKQGAEIILLACTDLQQIISAENDKWIIDSLPILEEATLSRLLNE